MKVSSRRYRLLFFFVFLHPKLLACERVCLLVACRATYAGRVSLYRVVVVVSVVVFVHIHIQSIERESRSACFIFLLLLFYIRIRVHNHHHHYLPTIYHPFGLQRMHTHTHARKLNSVGTASHPVLSPSPLTFGFCSYYRYCAYMDYVYFFFFFFALRALSY